MNPERVASVTVADSRIGAASPGRNSRSGSAGADPTRLEQVVTAVGGMRLDDGHSGHGAGHVATQQAATQPDGTLPVPRAIPDFGADRGPVAHPAQDQHGGA